MYKFEFILDFLLDFSLNRTGQKYTDVFDVWFILIGIPNSVQVF